MPIHSGHASLADRLLSTPLQAASIALLSGSVTQLHQQRVSVLLDLDASRANLWWGGRLPICRCGSLLRQQRGIFALCRIVKLLSRLSLSVEQGDQSIDILSFAVLVVANFLPVEI
jgi:hypothetical protein